MRRKWIAVLTAACLACFAGMSVSAFAGINVNNPSGEGLMVSGAVNSTNFKIMDDDEENPAVGYRRGNSTYSMTSWLTANKTFKNSERASDSRLTYQLDIPVAYDDSGAVVWTNKQLHIYPAASGYGIPTASDGKTYTTILHMNWGQERINVSLNANGDVAANTAFDDVPAGKIQMTAYDKDGAETKLIYNGGASEIAVLIGNGGTFGFGEPAAKAAAAAGREYFTFWIEADRNGNLVFYSGYDAHDGTPAEKIKTLKMTNAFKLPESAEEEYRFALSAPEGEFVVDNVSLTETHAVNGTDKTIVLKSCDFEDPSKLETGGTMPESAEFLSLAGRYNATLAEIVMTHPGADTRIATINKLAVDTSLAKTFEMAVSFKLEEMVSTRKVGVGFGLDSYRDTLTAPKNGASFLYLTVDADNKVVLGADNIDGEGNSTPAGTAVTLEDQAIGAEAGYIDLFVTGKSDNSIDVRIGEATYNFPGLSLNGAVALSQTGTGDVTYRIKDEGFRITGYQFDENDTAEAVTSSFDGNWINANKFAQQSVIAPESFITKTPESHAVAGMTAEDGKIGFYGTSTNTRLAFNDRYADFVLQFDYISVPYRQRGKLSGIESGNTPNRFSPFYVMFGSEATVSDLAMTYAIGIVEGNATQYFWGAESLVTPEGKLLTEGAFPTTVLSNLAETENSETAIPWYASKTGGGYEISKYGKPADEAKSLYNKTTRMKLVVINNNCALYAADVDKDGKAGDYRELVTFKVSNSAGYVSFGTDAPGWCELDNVAIAPIDRATAVAAGLDAQPKVDLVADVAVADMDKDLEPTPLAKPVPKADVAAKKVAWAAVEGAKEYKVTVKLGGVSKLEKTVTVTELDMSAYTDAGDYEVSVRAVAADPALHYDSNAAKVTYTVVKGGGNGGGEESKEPGGCDCGGGETAAAMLLLAGAAIAFKKLF